MKKIIYLKSKLLFLLFFTSNTNAYSYKYRGIPINEKFAAKIRECQYYENQNLKKSNKIKLYWEEREPTRKLFIKNLLKTAKTLFNPPEENSEHYPRHYENLIKNFKKNNNLPETTLLTQFLLPPPYGIGIDSQAKEAFGVSITQYNSNNDQDLIDNSIAYTLNYAAEILDDIRNTYYSSLSTLLKQLLLRTPSSLIIQAKKMNTTGKVEEAHNYLYIANLFISITEYAPKNWPYFNDDETLFHESHYEKIHLTCLFKIFQEWLSTPQNIIEKFITLVDTKTNVIRKALNKKYPSLESFLINKSTQSIPLLKTIITTCFQKTGILLASFFNYYGPAFITENNIAGFPQGIKKQLIDLKHTKEREIVEKISLMLFENHLELDPKYREGFINIFRKIDPRGNIISCHQDELFFNASLLLEFLISLIYESLYEISLKTTLQLKNLQSKDSIIIVNRWLKENKKSFHENSLSTLVTTLYKAEIFLPNAEEYKNLIKVSKNRKSYFSDIEEAFNLLKGVLKQFKK